jgi:5-formyltetrahydrofolate cyclo-ligase
MEAASLPVEATKPALRRQFLARRKNLKNVSARAARLQQHLTRFLEDLKQETPDVQVALYRALDGEASIDLAPLNDYYFPRLHGAGGKSTGGDAEMQFLRPDSPKDFTSNRMKILEPIASRSQPLSPDHPAAVCCPAVAVDRQGTRLGWGRGYYDRFFARHPEALRIGVAFQIQISTDPLPADGWDQPLDWIVTEEMILRTSNRSSSLWKSPGS